jgi:hypothetical protein
MAYMTIILKKTFYVNHSNRILKCLILINFCLMTRDKWLRECYDLLSSDICQ